MNLIYSATFIIAVPISEEGFHRVWRLFLMGHLLLHPGQFLDGFYLDKPSASTRVLSSGI
jgi:hypothetical protein